MSEYSRRILVFSAVAIVLGISISLGIAYLPMSRVAQTGTTVVSTQVSTAIVVSSVTSTVTASVSSTKAASTTTSVVSSGTTIVTSVSSVTTIVSSSTTAGNSTYSSMTSTSSATQTATTSTTVSCVVSGYPDGIFLRVLTNAGAPISGLAVSGQSVYTVNGETCLNPVSSTTNSTGWAYLGSNPGYYYVSVSYSGTGYNLTIPSRPVTESIATYYLPSGNLTIVYCTYGNPQMCSS